MRFFFRSILYFIVLIFRKREYDVIFYYPQHFNRGNKNKNNYFKHLIESCKDKGLRFIVFEEPDFSSRFKRNDEAEPFDVIFYFILLLRKLIFLKSYNSRKDKIIGKILAQLFFKRIYFKSLVTISQSMVNVFRGMDQDCAIFDLQHGIIHPNKKNYLENNIPAENLKNNNVNVLFFGKSFQDLLIMHDSTSFFKDRSFVIGSHIFESKNYHTSFNYKILVTLQFTHDHTNIENKTLLESLIKIISNSNRKNLFFLKHHPRFNNDINIDVLLDQDNVTLAPSNLKKCFETCSLHITSYSTCVFDASLVGIPTLIVNPLKKFDYFKKYFEYNFEYEINDFVDTKFYFKQSIKVKQWAKSYYNTYNENFFLSLIR